jgi:hypothetical protein
LSEGLRLLLSAYRFSSVDSDADADECYCFSHQAFSSHRHNLWRLEMERKAGGGIRLFFTSLPLSPSPNYYTSILYIIHTTFFYYPSPSIMMTVRISLPPPFPLFNKKCTNAKKRFPTVDGFSSSLISRHLLSLSGSPVYSPLFSPVPLYS